MGGLVLAYIWWHVVTWAILIGTPILYGVACLYVGSRVGGRLGTGIAVALIAAPIVWYGIAQFTFSRLCAGAETFVYHERTEGVDGLIARGRRAQDALATDVRSEDGYLFVEFEEQGRWLRQDPSGERVTVNRPRGRHEFEISEPRSLLGALMIWESPLRVRDVERDVVLAEGRDYLFGGVLLERLHFMQYGTDLLGCGPGISRGGWRGGKDSRGGRDERFSRRDREFVRSALVPARSSAGLSRTLDRPARNESRMGFQETLWQLASAIRSHGAYHEPGIYFGGSLPHDPRRPPSGAMSRLEAKRVAGDPDYAGALYWAEVLINPRQSGRDLTMPRIRVLQRPGAVVVKAAQLQNSNEVLDTRTLLYRRTLANDVDQFVSKAVQPPAPFAATLAQHIASPHSVEVTARRVLDALTESPAYAAARAWPDPARREGKPVRIQFVRRDAELMRKVFSYDGRFDARTGFYVEVQESGGGSGSQVDTSALLRGFPERLNRDLAAQYASEINALLLDALRAP